MFTMYHFFPILIFVARNAHTLVLQRGPCLFVRNETFIEGEFNNVTQICCSGSGVHNKDKDYNIECCGETTYKTETQICCGGKVLERADDDRICCKKVSDSKGGFVYSVSNIRKPKCCGLQVYSSLQNNCLNGVLLDKNKRNTQDLKVMKSIKQTGKRFLRELQRFINLSIAENLWKNIHMKSTRNQPVN